VNTMTLDRIAPVASTNATQFIVQSNVPLPPRTYGTGAATKYPFAEMRVGDSFAVSLSDYAGRGKTPTTERIQTALSNSARNYAKMRDPRFKFATRKVDAATIRIWRIA
jgi:hypothetical protein